MEDSRRYQVPQNRQHIDGSCFKWLLELNFSNARVFIIIVIIIITLINIIILSIIVIISFIITTTTTSTTTMEGTPQ